MDHKAQGKPLEQPQLQCPATLSCFMSRCPEARETILIIQLLGILMTQPHQAATIKCVKQGDWAPF